MPIPVDILQTGAQFDADTYSLKYFGVSENFTKLKKGKNTITLSPSIYLKKESIIEVEFYIVDENGREISYPVQFPNKVTSSGNTILEIIIEDDVPLSSAILYIAGIMTINVDTGEKFDDPTEFNLVWKGFSRIVEGDIDDESPDSKDDVVLEHPVSDITVSVTPEDCTYREPAEDRNKTHTGTGKIFYFSTQETSQTNNSLGETPTVLSKKTVPSVTDSDDSLSGNFKPSSTPINEQPLPIINSTAAEFTSDMVGGKITISTPDITPYVPGNLLDKIGTVPLFTATIVEIVNNKTIRVDGFFKYSIPGEERIITQFESTSYNVKYSKNVASSPGQKVTGCAKLCFDNVATSNGTIKGVKVAAKPVGGLGGAVDLGTFTPNFTNKLEDTSDYEYSPTGGAKYKSAGSYKSQADVNNYLEVADYREKKTANTTPGLTKDFELVSAQTATQNSNNLIDAATVQEPNSSEVRLISINDSYLASAKANTEYTLKFDLHSTKISDRKPEVEVYILGPGIENQTNQTPFGSYLKTYTLDDGRSLKGEKITFKTVTDAGSIKPYFLIKAGTWDIGNVEIVPDSSTKNGPNEFCITVPLDALATNVIGEEFIFEIDFIGSNGKPLGLNLTTQNVILNQNATIDEQLIINTFLSSNLIQNIISGSVTSVSSSFSDTVTLVSGSLIYSGSFFTGPDLIRLYKNNGTEIDILLNLPTGYGDSDVLDYINSIGVRSGSDADTDTITTVGTSSLGSSGTITLIGSGSIDISEIKTVSGSIITIFSDANPQKISGSLISASYNSTTGILELNRQYTSSLQVSIDTYDNWIISDGSTCSNITNGDKLTITGTGGITSTLSGCTLTLNSAAVTADTLCTVTTAGDCTAERSCFVAATDSSTDGGLCARGHITLTSYCTNGKCDMVLDTLRGSIYLCPAAGVGIGTSPVNAKAGSITLNQLNCSQGVRIFNLPSNTTPTHIVSICNPTSTSYTGDGCQSSLQYTCINDLATSLSSFYSNCQGTVTSIATNNGITGGTITSTGTIGLTGQALALHNLATNGFISRTGAGTVAGRTITGGTNITVTNGDGVSGNPTISTSATTCTGTVTSVATGTGLTGGTITSTGTISLSHLGIQSLTDPNADRIFFWDDSAGTSQWLSLGTNLSITGTTLNATDTNTTYTATDMLNCIKTVDGTGSGLDADLLDGLNSTCFYLASNPSGYTTCTGTVTSIATNNGITGGTITSTGTIGLTGQALALHNLATNGFIVRTGVGTVAARTLTAGTNITITNCDGVGGNPTISTTVTNTDVDVSVSNLVTRLSQIGCTTYTIGSGTGVTACFSGNICTSRCMTADNFITTSDVRLKSDLKEIKDSIKVLKQFSSYCYMKNGYEDAGFIAQEVCTAIPFSVNENAEGYLTMRDRPILAYLHSAIIDINNRLENIEQNL